MRLFCLCPVSSSVISSLHDVRKLAYLYDFFSIHLPRFLYFPVCSHTWIALILFKVLFFENESLDD